MVVAGGATLIQLRDKHGATRRMIEEARAIKAVLAGTGVPLVVNDRVDVALARRGRRRACRAGRHARSRMRAGCSGPRRSSGCRSRAWRWRTPRRSMRSTMSAIGGVYATTSKDNPNPPIGIDGLRDIVAAFRARRRDFPVCGIAGIDAGECGAGDRRRRRWRRGDLGAVDAAPIPRPPRASCARVVDAERAGETTMTAIAVTIAGSDSERRRRHPGRPEDVLGARRLRRVGDHRADRAEHARRDRIHDVPPHFIAAQIDAVFSDLEVNAVKIGMLSRAGRDRGGRGGARSLARRRRRARPRDGRDLGRPAARAGRGRGAQARPHPARAGHHAEPARGGGAARRRRSRATRREMRDAGASSCSRLGAQGGADQGRPCAERGERRPAGHARRGRAADGGEDRHARTRTAPAARCPPRSPPGLAKGYRLSEAVRRRQGLCDRGDRGRRRLEIGQGRGPTHHFHAWW